MTHTDPDVMRLVSRAFSDGQPLPSTYTSAGADLSPPLAWSRAPADTRSLALLCEDDGGLVHWLLWNIDPRISALDEGSDVLKTSEDGMRQGANSFGTFGYVGPRERAPCTFHLYALDTRLALPETTTHAEFSAAIAQHVLADARLVTRAS